MRRRIWATSDWRPNTTRISRRRFAAIRTSSCTDRCASRGTAWAPTGKTELVEDLPEVARHTSERERRANDAERELVQWKKVRFMTDKVGDVFHGYITGVSAFGLFIELVEHFVEGMVHVSTMADDYYRFVERAHVLRGEKNGRVYRLGDRVEVQVIRVDLERRQIDLGLMEILDAVRRSDRPRGGSSKPPQRQPAKHEERGRPRKKRPGRRERSTKRRGR